MPDVDWMRQQFGYLSLQLGAYKLGDRDGFLFDPTPGFYGLIAQGTTEALNFGMWQLADHVGARGTPVVEEWEGPADPLATLGNDWTHDDAPGMIRYDGPSRSRIQVALSIKHNALVMGAVLAHELAHHYLMSRRISLAPASENERLTDFATVFLGLGKLTLNGYAPVTWTVNGDRGSVTYTSRVGYLSQQDIAESLLYVCSVRGITEDRMTSQLSDAAVSELERARWRSQVQVAYRPYRPGLLRRLAQWFVLGRADT
ncbi:MAG: hypothetical protein ACE149_00020 [Armatimonadota bacterium]